MVKRKGTTSKKTFVVDNFMQEKEKYLKSMKSKVEMYNNPLNLQLIGTKQDKHCTTITMENGC